MGKGKRLISVRIDESLLEKVERLDVEPQNRTSKIEKTLRKGLRLM